MEKKIEKKNKFLDFLTQSFGAFGKYVLGKSISCVIMIVVGGTVLKVIGVKAHTGSALCSESAT